MHSRMFRIWIRTPNEKSHVMSTTQLNEFILIFEVAINWTELYCYSKSIFSSEIIMYFTLECFSKTLPLRTKHSFGSSNYFKCFKTRVSSEIYFGSKNNKRTTTLDIVDFVFCFRCNRYFSFSFSTHNWILVSGPYVLIIHYPCSLDWLPF